ncbi:integrase core domain-containing protein [Sulfitobacter sp. Ks41]|uniref:integrase core domain-containing protein n=1 Tax=Sulfitobacter sp. Ks41 TaxID=2731139 RepID=UPI0023E213FE|nr:integrase core domain-containing protein [Sulfitobacter sp. Ks41]
MRQRLHPRRRECRRRLGLRPHCHHLYRKPGDLEQQIGAFVDYYNNQRYHESLNNVTPADVYFVRDKAILREREKIKKLTIRQRRLQHQKQAA